MPKGEKTAPPYRVDVKDLFAAPKPYGWQIYRRGDESPVVQSPLGYASETDAWNAGASALQQVLRIQRKRG